ncbi:MAG TPA: transposase, partial [Micromonosporaceae bacterium]|nr:transposase [Micromonosporaceae bacterium]
MADWLPERHPVWFVIEVVADLDTGAFHAHRVQAGPGAAAYDPDMLLTLLVYGAWHGVRSSRAIEQRCLTDVAFRIICGSQPPDHATIARFRQQHAAAFTDLFSQVLLLCARAGMGRFGRVAIDGTKVAGNASRAANVRLEQVRRIAAAELTQGLAADAAEERADGDRGADPPAGLRDRSQRAARIAAVRAELQAAAEAQTRRARQQGEQARRYAQQVADEVAGPGQPPRGTDRVALAQMRLDRAIAARQAALDAWAGEAALPLMQRSRIVRRPKSVDDCKEINQLRAALQRATAKAAARRGDQQTAAAHAADQATAAHHAALSAAQATTRRNLTDPDSRLMPTSHGWIQGYNAQLAVTDDHLILAVTACQTPGDVDQAQPMTSKVQQAAAAITAHTGRADTTIGLLLFDAGYLSEANLTAPGPDRLIATGKHRTLEHTAR